MPSRRQVHGGIVEQRAHPSRAAAVVAMGVREDDVTDPLRSEALSSHVLDDRLGAHPGSDVDQRELVTPVEQIDVAVEWIRHPEADGPGSDEVDAVRQFHRASAREQ